MFETHDTVRFYIANRLYMEQGIFWKFHLKFKQIQEKRILLILKTSVNQRLFVFSRGIEAN